MQYSQHVHSVRIRLDRICENYRFLCRPASLAESASLPPALLPAPGGNSIRFFWPDAMAVVKADAYGHGHVRTAQALMREGATMFASGGVRESVLLRRGLQAPRDAMPPAILSLLGPMNSEDVRMAAEHGIIPLIHSFWQLPLLRDLHAPLAIAVKCNTGMSRLGFEEEELEPLLHELGRLPRVSPVLALSHLAAADTDQATGEIRSQGLVFARMLGILRSRLPSIAASLGNSAGTLLAGEITGLIGPHICRPGIALYGGNPFAGTAHESLGKGLAPAMAISAPIIAVRELAAGGALGYGHTFRASQAMRVGIVSVGYADSYPRSLSNKGAMCVLGKRASVLGRVAMQMTAVDLSRIPEARPGDDAWLMGGPYAGGLGPEELAALWGTITYEILCLLGNKGNRIYEE